VHTGILLPEVVKGSFVIPPDFYVFYILFIGI